MIEEFNLIVIININIALLFCLFYDLRYRIIPNWPYVYLLLTGLIVGYPPCPRIDQFKKFIPEKYGMEVVIGTHPIPAKYFSTHTNLKTWESSRWKELIKETLADEETRTAYN